MTLKEFWNTRVVSKDKRVPLNRLVKDSIFYGFMILCFMIIALMYSGNVKDAKYALYLAIIIVIARFVLKMFEKYRPEQFKWFWETSTVVLKIINLILKMSGKPTITEPSNEDLDL